MVSLAAIVALVAWATIPTGARDGAKSTSLRASTGSRASGGEGAAASLGATSAGEGAAATSAGPASASLPGATGGGPAAGASGAAGANGAAAAGGSAAGAGGPGCLKAPAGTPGVTDTTITIAFGYLNLAGPIGNGAVGVATPDEFRRMATAVAADINARGGVQCRTIQLKFYEGNPLNQDQTHAVCLQAAADRPFLFADAGAFAYPQGVYNCLPQQKVPILTPQLILPSEIARFSPYLATYSSDASTAMRDAAFGLKQRAFFDPAKGFKKLGLLYDQCGPEVNRLLDTYLAKAGVTASQISKFQFACPSSGFASPSDMAQAVNQFRLAGVTHVIPLTGGGSFSTSFTNAAEGQRFRPKYALTDYQGIILTTASAMKPNADNFDGGTAVTIGSYGMDTTPGFPLDAGTRRCQAILVRAGFTPDYTFGKIGGGVCSALWSAEAAIKGARALTREALFPGLFNAGLVQLAYPNTDATFRAPAKFFGGDTWAQLVWLKSCGCWHNLDPKRLPSFAP